MIIEEAVTINRPIGEVYEAFADLKRWIAILPDVLDVQILYFDGYNQEFTMTVERPAGPETVRGIRYCRPNVELELFQPVPPPGLKQMSGRWTFTQHEAQTSVVATRRFQLLDTTPGSDDEFGQKLSKILHQNLELFKKAIENDGAN